MNYRVLDLFFFNINEVKMKCDHYCCINAKKLSGDYSKEKNARNQFFPSTDHGMLEDFKSFLERRHTQWRSKGGAGGAVRPGRHVPGGGILR